MQWDLTMVNGNQSKIVFNLVFVIAAELTEEN